MYAKALKLPVFPLLSTEYKRSILYIDCLSELVRLIVESNQGGIYCPQNVPRLSTNEIIREIKKILRKRTLLLELPSFLEIRCQFINKRFGNQCYTEDFSRAFNNRYCIVDTYDAIQKTLQGK